MYNSNSVLLSVDDNIYCNIHEIDENNLYCNRRLCLSIHVATGVVAIRFRRYVARHAANTNDRGDKQI